MRARILYLPSKERCYFTFLVRLSGVFADWAYEHINSRLHPFMLLPAYRADSSRRKELAYDKICPEKGAI